MMQYKIMVVDDEPANIRLLERLFRRSYQVLTATSGADALRLLGDHDVALLITDQRMPGMTGIELLKRTSEFRPHMVRIILTGYTDVSALVEAINCGQVYKYVTKPWNNDDLRMTVERAIEFYETNKSRHELEASTRRLTSRLQAASQAFMRGMADVQAATDPFALSHALRVSGYVEAIADLLELDDATIAQSKKVALMHGLGQVVTGMNRAAHVSQSADDLAINEASEAATRWAARMLIGVPDLEEVADAVGSIARRFDGANAPDGMGSYMIPLPARMVQTASAYALYTSPRDKHDAISHEQAIWRLQGESGTRFDPVTVKALAQVSGLATIQETISRWDRYPITSQLQSAELASMSLAQLIDLACHEPAIAVRLVQHCRDHEPDSEIGNLRAACERLGLEKLRSLIADTRSVGGTLLLHDDHREKALRCAYSARLLADQTRSINPEIAHTLGLLHDWGSVLLWQLFPIEMAALVPVADDAEQCVGETRMFGMNHAELGCRLLIEYGFPQELAFAVQTHHEPNLTNDPIALLLNVAHGIARANHSSKIAALDLLGAERLSWIGLSRGDLSLIHTFVMSEAAQRIAA